jgi:CelD/BcsL family acetyltransferase involved in cellulose biosynthesis
LVAEVRTGAGVLARSSRGFDRLAQRLGLPLTARLDYLGRFAAAHPEWRPWVVAVTGADGEWQAGALLARRRRYGLTRITGLGHQVCDHGRLPATDAAAATVLAEAIAVGLAVLPGPWTLRLEQLPADDPVARLLAARLRHAEIVAGVGLPRIDLSAGPEPATYLTKKYRQQVEAARRRFAAAGVRPRLVHLRTPAEVEPVLADLLEIRRSRDRAALYRRELDDERRAGWWRAAMLHFAELGQLELTVLDVGAGPPAGYNAALLDGTSYRCWDGRINPAWHQQWPGQLLFGELLPRVIADPRWSEIDYLRGETPFKLRTATDVVPTSHLLAWSSASVRLASGAPGAARGRLRIWKDAHPAADRAWRAARTRLRP